MDRRMWSYIELAHLLRRVSSHPEADAKELFVRAVFNALTTNLDDHPRNHAVIWEGDGWRLSPAYDLTPSPAQSREERLLAMDVGDLPGRVPRWANRATLRSGARHFGFTEEEANEVISRLKAIVLERWRPIARELGGTQRFQDQIAHAFPDAYPGFEFEAPPGT
jgi:serine/threonine-protein kinase HipA